jgi:hypothetical protein
MVYNSERGDKLMVKVIKKSKIFLLFLIITIVTVISASIASTRKHDTAVNRKMVEFANKNNYNIKTGHTLIKMHENIETLIKESDVVFIGTVKQIGDPIKTMSEPSKTSDGKKIAVGFVNLPTRVKVNEVIKGNINDNEMIKVYQKLGDIMGSNMVTYVGLIEYKEKDQYVFFLNDYKDGYRGYSHKQGQLFIREIDINDDQTEDDYKIKIDRNYFNMFDDMITFKELKKQLKVK